MGFVESHNDDKFFPLYSTNRLIFVMEAHCVLCEILSECLILLLHTNRKHQIFLVAYSVRVHCASMFRMGSSNSSLAMKSCASASVTLLALLRKVFIVICLSGSNCPQSKNRGPFYFVTSCVIML